MDRKSLQSNFSESTASRPLIRFMDDLQVNAISSRFMALNFFAPCYCIQDEGIPFPLVASAVNEEPDSGISLLRV